MFGHRLCFRVRDCKSNPAQTASRHEGVPHVQHQTSPVPDESIEAKLVGCLPAGDGLCRAASTRRPRPKRSRPAQLRHAGDGGRAADARPDGLHRRPGRNHHAARVRDALHLRCQVERGADAGRGHAEDLRRRQDLRHHIAPRRDAAQRPRAHGRRRGRQPAALDGTVAARQGRGQGNRQPQGQGPAGHRHRAEGTLRAAAVAARAAQRHGRHHGQGLHRLAAEGVRGHRPLQVQGAPPRPVRAAHALRQVRRAQGARERLRRQARSGH
jgi:hypothetical protein